MSRISTLDLSTLRNNNNNKQKLRGADPVHEGLGCDTVSKVELSSRRAMGLMGYLPGAISVFDRGSGSGEQVQIMRE